MASPESTRAVRAVNPPTFEHDILGFVEAGLAVVPRPDLGAVEVRIRDAGEPPVVILLAPRQAMAVAALLVAAVAGVDREGGA